MNKGKILITGGTGTVGQVLSSMLDALGYEVCWLSRGNNIVSKYKIFKWNPEKKTIDTDALNNCKAVINLAGAGVFDKPWTDEYKKLIYDSRIQSTLFLNECIKKLSLKPECFISASAIGIYGSAISNDWIHEDSKPAQGFLSDVVKDWELAADRIAQQGIRTVKLRIGIVLSPKGGAYEQLAMPIKFGFGAALGSGTQWVPWIHITDLCSMIVHSIKNQRIEGVCNAVSPNPVSNSELTKVIAKYLKMPLWLPNIPAFVMNLILGKGKAAFVLGGSRVSADKICKDGFIFKYPSINSAIQALNK